MSSSHHRRRNPAAAHTLANADDGLVVVDAATLHQALDWPPAQHLRLSPETATAFARMGLRAPSRVQAQPRDSLAKLTRLLSIRPLAVELHDTADVNKAGRASP